MSDRVPTRASTRCCGTSARRLGISLVKTALLAAVLLTGVATHAFAQGSISGRVTSSTTGLGLPNTVIQIFDFNEDDFGVQVTTDATGDYTVNLPAGMYALLTQNTLGYINEIYNNIPCSAVCDTSTVVPLVVTNSPIIGIDFVLNPGGRITGRVTSSAGGAGIAGVTVYIVVGMGDEFPFTKAVTDASGNYTSEGGTVTGTVRAFTANTQGFQNEAYNNRPCLNCDVGAVGDPISVTLAGGASNIDFILDPGGRITGNVSTTSGAPLPNALVEIYNSMGNSVDETTTDAMGNYSTGGLPTTGNYFAVAEAPGFVHELFDNLPCAGGACQVLNGTAIPVTAGMTTSGKNFVLAPGGTITGTVTNAATGAPIPNVFVAINSQTSFLGGTQTNDSGVYSVVVPPGTVFANVINQPGFANQLYHGLPCGSSPGCPVANGTAIVVSAGATTGNVDFALVPEFGTISGTVTNTAGGAGLNNINVQVYSSAGTLIGNVNTSGAGAGAGFYQFNGLAPGSYYVKTNTNQAFINQVYNGVVCVFCNVVTSGGTLVPVTAGGTTDIDFALTAGGRINATITDGTNPILGAAVQFFSSAGVLLQTGNVGAGGFTSAGLPAGNYYVRTGVTAAQNFIDELYNDHPCVPCTVTTGELVAAGPPGGASTVIGFVLAPGGSISGTVTDAAGGAPIPAMGVLVFNSAGVVVKTTTTDASGNYTVAGLPAGNYFVRTNPNAVTQNYVGQLYNGFPSDFLLATVGTPVDVTVGATHPGINFALVSGGGISGTVTGGGGPLAGVQIVAYSPTGRTVKNTLTDAAGGFTLTGLPAGNYYVSTNVGIATPFYQDELFDNIPCLGCTTLSGQNLPIVTLPCALPCAPTVTTGTQVTVANGTTRTGVDFTLASGGGGITGTVSAAGIGLSNVQVVIYNAAGVVVKNVTTAANTGIYLVRGLAPGTYYARTIVSPATPYYTDVAYHLPSPAPCAPCDVTTAGTAITVTADTTTNNIDFPMTAGGAISGSVSNETTASPLASVDVQLFNNAGTLVKTTFTGSTGKFEFDGLPAGTYYARTADELYLNTACPPCVVTSGTGIVVTNGATHGGIDFGLLPSVPTVVTTAATSISPTGATLNGTVNPNGSSATALFQYGLTTGYGSQVAASPAPGSGIVAVAVSAAITGLTCNTPYHFRLNATSAGATTNGLDATFTTGACPTIAPIPSATTKTNTPIPVPLTVGSTAGAAGLILTGSSSNVALVPNGNLVFSGAGANRTLTITPAAGQQGVATITVTASDSTGTASAPLTLLVTAALKPIVPGTRSTFTLNNATEEHWESISTVAGRSYCAQLAPSATAVTQATPTWGVFGDDTTPLGTAGPAGRCFVAPAGVGAFVNVMQTDASARSYVLRVVETTLWTDWFFVGGDYSSFTLLRNTTGTPITATLTWRGPDGTVVGTQTLVVPRHGIVFIDARAATTGATAGSVEVAHDGEPQALIGSQTTLSASTGLSFDTVLFQRIPR